MATGPASRLMPKLRRVVLAEAVANRTDGQLLGAFVADRDADAFAALVRRHGPMVLGVSRRVTGDHSTADDAFQAVFIVLARRASSIKPREQVGNWLYGVAYRTALKARAVQARRRSREKQVEVMPEHAVSGAADVWSDLQPVIDEELTRLPDKLRLPVVLCDLEGRAQREVAKHLGIPPATLATRLATARRTLADRLTRRGVTLSGGALAGLLTVHGTVSAVSHSTAYGLAQAAEAVAGGAIATSLVSPQVIHLSEGVIRMMLLSKLKMVAVSVLTVAALSGGLGLGLVPATAGDDPAQTGKPAVVVATPPAGAPANPGTNQTVEVVLNERNFDFDVDDQTFLRHLTLDLRGTLPTDVETWFFVADEDADKRTKVVVWMSEDDAIQAQLAKKLNVPADKIRLTRVVTAKDGKPVTLVVVTADDVENKDRVAQFTVQKKQSNTPSTQAAGQTWNFTTVADGDKLYAWDVTGGKDEESKKKVKRIKVLVLEDQNSSTALLAERFLRLPLPDDKATDGRVREALTRSAGLAVMDYDGDGIWDLGVSDLLLEIENLNNSDADFLKRVLLDVRGTPPTSLEEKYFLEDKDLKKREKLLDTLLKDPAIAKKLGDEWKKKMLAPSPPSGDAAKERKQLRIVVDPRLEVTPAPKPQVQPVKPSQFEFRLVGPNEIVPVPAKPNAPQPPTPAKPPAAPQAGQFELRLVGPPQPPTPAKPPVAPQSGQLELRFTRPNEVTPVPAKPNTPQPPTPAKPQAGQLELRFTGPNEIVPVPAKPNVPQPPAPAKPPVAQQSHLEKLVGELLAAKKSDAEMLEAVTLATVGRLPTDAEKRLTLGLVSKAADRTGAWIEVAKALSATEEGMKRGSGIRFTPKVIEVMPAPPTKP